MHPKTTFNVALLLLKLLKLYPYTCFDPTIIVRGFFVKSYSHFKHMILKYSNGTLKLIYYKLKSC
jgi:hypothetical protein